MRNALLSRINELGQSIKQIFFQKNLNVFSTNFQIDQIFHHLTKQTLYHQSNNTYIVLHIYIYICTLIRYQARIVITIYQIRVKAEVEDKSSVNKQNGVTASSSTVFRTAFFRRGGHISTRGNVKRRFQRAN